MGRLLTLAEKGGVIAVCNQSECKFLQRLDQLQFCGEDKSFFKRVIFCPWQRSTAVRHIPFILEHGAMNNNSAGLNFARQS